MKKLMFVAFAAVAMVGAANAATEYNIQAYCYVLNCAMDTGPSNLHGSWYSFYVMKQEDAQAAMGTTETVTYKTMATWLGNNFAANKASVIAKAENIGFTELTEEGQYSFLKEGSMSSGLKSAIGVCFYDDSVNVAYNVLQGDLNAFFNFDDGQGSDSYNSGWLTASVPEPTSGLLLLLGMAGLALKRKMVVA